MRRPSSQGLVIGIFVFLSPSFPLTVQEPQVTLTLQTQDGQTTFHIGERIPLNLIFSSQNDTQFRIDRREAIGCGGENVKVSPSTGWSDPLGMDRAQNECAYSGPGPAPLLKARPLAVMFDLNQWVRFDEPGDYQVKVSSRGVIEVSGADGTHIPLESNVLELHIIAATPEWQESVIRSVPPQQEADIRYLGTPAAIEKMVTPNLDSTGLIELPDSMHATAIESMNKLIDDPGYAITDMFFFTWASLHITPSPNMGSRLQQVQSFEAILWSQVLEAAKKKRGAAQAHTVQTLFAHRRFVDKPESNADLVQLLLASFTNLSAGEQIEDLQHNWDTLRSPDVLPLLQELARLPATNNDQNSPFSRMDLKSAALKRWYELDPVGARREILAQIGSATPSLSAGALTFMPAEPLPQFEGVWAQAFVDTKYQLQEDTLGSLLVHFGTGAAKTLLLSKLDEQPSSTSTSCESHAFVLAYLVRFSPEDVRPLLEHALHDAPPGCKGNLLQLISRQATGPVINDVAAEALNLPNETTDADVSNDRMGIIRDALEYLTSYGRPSDEKPILDRYTKWSQAWSGKADVLDSINKCRLVNDPSSLPKDVLAACQDSVNNQNIGVALGKALIANQGWFADTALIDRVLDMCRGEYVCKQLRDVAATAGPPYYLGLPDVSGWNGVIFSYSQSDFVVSQYTPRSLDLLEAKISQYPPNTKFLVRMLPQQGSDGDKLEETVQAILRNQGMELQIATP